MKALFKRSVFIVLSTLLVASLSIGLVGCGGGAATGSGESGTADSLTVIKVGATPSPHAEILANLKDDLAAEGFDLQIIEYTDYVKPNLDTSAGDIIANFFQHQPYLDEFNAENGTDLVSAAIVHFEPLGIYPGKTTSLDDLADGATIAVPNDPTNEARALHLLAAQGLITLPANADLLITPKDIVDNPKNIKFLEVEAAAVPRSLEEVDVAVVNGNYALDAGLDVSTALATEDPDSQAAQTFANILAVDVKNENDPGVLALAKALTSDKTRDFIKSTYEGIVIPVF